MITEEEKSDIARLQAFDGETKIQRFKDPEALVNRLQIDIKKFVLRSSGPQLVDWRIVANENNEIALTQGPETDRQYVRVYATMDITGDTKKIVELIKSTNSDDIFDVVGKSFWRQEKERY